MVLRGCSGSTDLLALLSELLCLSLCTEFRRVSRSLQVHLHKLRRSVARDTFPLPSLFASAEFSLKMGPSRVSNVQVLGEGTWMRALVPASLAPIKPSSSLGSCSPSLKRKPLPFMASGGLCHPQVSDPPVASGPEEGWLTPGTLFPFEQF